MAQMEQSKGQADGGGEENAISAKSRMSTSEKSKKQHSAPTTPDTQRVSGREKCSDCCTTLAGNIWPNSLLSMSVTRTVPLLICSLGNPGSTYANTLHSAGHTILNYLGAHFGGPTFEKDRALGNGLVSHLGDWTLWQSTSYMNESGKGVRAAWQKWSRGLPDDGGRLVVIHDELEKPFGTVSLRTTPGASAKGHNGLKSVLSSIGNQPFARIGIGIGRPVSRESADVARYVLKKMTPAEKQILESSVQEVIAKLKTLERG